MERKVKLEVELRCKYGTLSKATIEDFPLNVEPEESSLLKCDSKNISEIVKGAIAEGEFYDGQENRLRQKRLSYEIKIKVKPKK